ncbi:hypothetical protein QV65_07650 [Rhodococcus erythropolis]|nr:hypothetical protein QV65_07650 [Rhodococcus erythropolis]
MTGSTGRPTSTSRLPTRVTESVFAELLVPEHVLGAATGGHQSAVFDAAVELSDGALLTPQEVDAAGQPSSVVDFDLGFGEW